MAHQKDLRIDWACDCVAAHLWVDPQKITQVINNLLSNAVKFSHPGGKITVRAADAGADTVEISISDTGVGIPDGELSQIFKPFAKLSVKATRGEKSTGLGMVIVKNIVEAHGGTIRVESAPSKGTTVSFTVPRKD
ncbi:MAG: ATP-binding protein [Candidatus Omnitrophota bacterium]